MYSLEEIRMTDPEIAAAIAQIVPVTAKSRKNDRNVVRITVPALLKKRRIRGLRRVFFLPEPPFF